MFDAVRNNKRLVQIFLVLITIPFAFFGIDFYMNSGSAGGESVAEVGKTEIGENELLNRMRQQESALVAERGAAEAAEIVASPEFRSSVLNTLVNERVLAQLRTQDRLVVPDSLLRDLIVSNEAFRDGGQFSRERFSAFLQSNGLSEGVYLDNLRQQYAGQMLFAPVIQSAHPSNTVLKRWLALQDETRVVSELHIALKPYQDKVKLEADASRKYYDANLKGFQLPEQAKVEYLVLSAAELTKQVKVTDADVRKYYDENASRFITPEERRASHILVMTGSALPQAEMDAARKKAEDLLAKVKASPADFAKIAKASSEDSSASEGGDLGFFKRDAMVKPFADAVWALKPGETSGVVQSEFGFHIIRLAEVRGGAGKSFDAVKNEIQGELVQKEAERRFAELSEQFKNAVFEQVDSLAPVAGKFSLSLQNSDWIERNGAPDGVLANPKLLSAIFAADVLKDKKITAAVELDSNTLAAARVVEHKPAAVRPFESVRQEIETQLVFTEAANAAAKDGYDMLLKLRKGEAVTGKWNASKSLKRESPELWDAARAAVFGAPSATLPSYAGVGLPEGGYTIYRIEKVTLPEVSDTDPRLAGARSVYLQIAGEADTLAYLQALRTRMKAKITDRGPASEPATN